MHRFLYKIFFWFWLGIVLVIVTWVGLTAFTRSRTEADESWRNKYGPRVDLLAQREVEVLDRDGRSGLEKYIGTFAKEPRVQGYMFDANGREVLGRVAPPSVLEIAKEMRSSLATDPVYFTAQRIIAENIAGPSGREYAVVMTYPQPSLLRRPLFDFLFTDLRTGGLIRFFAVAAVAGFFCFWLARQITNPIEKLRLATREIANEHLRTRVDETLLTRGDELADLSRDFDRMAERIDGLVTAQRRLLVDVSHALRSPLARLSVALGLAREVANPESSEHLDRIERETDRLNQLIGQLVTMARADSGVDLEQKKVFDVSLLLEEVAADGNYEAVRRNCAVKFDVPSECLIEGAPEMLRGAFENVVRNAIRHTADGTNVDIAMEFRPVGSGSRAVIQVRDHGTGVPEDALTELFLPFRQVPNSSSQNGTGLGLAITEQAFRLHGGSATAANAAGGGLLITLELPIFDSNRHSLTT
jgi:signal transduction histidine kinase